MNRIIDALCYFIAACVWFAIFGIFAILSLPLIALGAIVSPRRPI